MAMLSIFMTQGYTEYIDKIYSFLILLDFWCKACIITLDKISLFNVRGFT